MTRQREPSKTPWFRQHDEDAHHALRQAGVIPWERPLEGVELGDYLHARWMRKNLVFFNLLDPPERGTMQQAMDVWRGVLSRNVL